MNELKQIKEQTESSRENPGSRPWPRDPLEKYNNLFDELFPIFRTILGQGFRNSLKIISKHIPFNIIEVNSGTRVFDWVVPREWILEEAYIENAKGERVVDVNAHNLHILYYSVPYTGILPLEELKKHLFTDKRQPGAIPYVTSYYKKNWGFCMAYNDFAALEDGAYKVVIDSRFVDGILQIGEVLLPGRSEKEILITSYLCHPSMANNELSGPLVLLYLYEQLKKMPSRTFSYRFVINPETIGSIAYLCQKFETLKQRVIGGLVLTCLGGPVNSLSYKKSKSGYSIIDRYFAKAGAIGEIRAYKPLGGSDERQYNSIGINIPMGQVARTVYEQHPEYHTSLDDKVFMDMRQVMKSGREIFNIIRGIEDETFFINLRDKCEPHLGKHNLYPDHNLRFKEEAQDHKAGTRTFSEAVMFLLSYSCGTRSVEEIAEISGIDLSDLMGVAQKLETHNLLKKI